MFKALYQHIYYLLSFKHNGEGLKTDIYFTATLFSICFLFSLLPYESLKPSIILINFLALLMLCSMTNKNLINGILLGAIVFFLISFCIPLLSLFFMIWIILATVKMQKRYYEKTR